MKKGSRNEASTRDKVTLSTPPNMSITGGTTVQNVFLATHPVPSHISSVTERGRRLADKDLIGLYQAIETALPDHDSRIVQFVSCYAEEGAKTIGTELSILVARNIGHRTLFIGLESASPASVNSGPRKAIASLNDVANGRAQIASAIAESPANAMQCDYAYISSGETSDNILAYTSKLEQILEVLRNKYHLIVFHASDILANPVGVSLGRLADGVIFVIEAERTRAPAARQALSYMRDKGVHVIGMAFNKRRYYIPRWLYRSL